MFENLKARHAELVEASLPNDPSGVVEMLRQAQHDVLIVILENPTLPQRAGKSSNALALIEEAG
jgi:hypothetical protein